MLTKFNFDKIGERVAQMKRDLPRVLANDTKNYFTQNFKKQEWNGTKWAEVERRKPDTNAYKYPKKGADSRHGRAILVKSGNLRRDVGNSLERADWDMIKFTVRNDYGIYHNEGGENLPKRQFMGDNPELRKRQLAKIKSYVQRIWQG
jgi:phage gpG-like protein